MSQRTSGTSFSYSFWLNLGDLGVYQLLGGGIVKSHYGQVLVVNHL